MGGKTVYDPTADRKARKTGKAETPKAEEKVPGKAKPEKPKKPEKTEKKKPEKKAKPKPEPKSKRDPHIRPLIKSHRSILVVIPSDIRDEAHLLEAKEQGIDARVDYNAEARTITIRLLKEPVIVKTETEGKA